MRREIQGLRAVAVLLVVVFHLWPQRLAGGYVGVDVFFVISGFLITAHLLREVDRTGSVRLGEFWARRLRRLLPAAYVVLAVSALGVLLLVPRLLWRQFLGEVLAAVLYVENWALAVGSVDYLAADDQPSPAQHYWTLSAEEQFYLVWPLLVLAGITLAARLGRGHRAGVLAVLGTATAGSLAYSLWVTAVDPAWAYFVTPARAWEFGAGALLALAPAATGGRAARALLGGAGLAVVVGAALVLDEETPMPGTAAVVVVLAAAAVIWAGDPQLAWSPSRLLTWRPAVAVGDVSYATYLWHWPLVVLLPHATGHDLTPAEKVGVLAATLALAALTERWVEDPVRRTHRLGLRRPRTTFAWAAVATLVLGAVCVAPRVSVAREVARDAQAAEALAERTPRCFGAASRDPAVEGCPDPGLADVVVPAPESARQDWPAYPACTEPLAADPLRPCRFGGRSDEVPHVAVVGDSHARVLMAGVQRLVDEGHLTADMLVTTACPWSTHPPNLREQSGRDCADFRERLATYLERRAGEYDAVLTTARLSTLRGSEEERVTGLAEAMASVTRRGVPVAVLRDNPGGTSPDDDPNLCLAEVEPGAARRCALDRGPALDDRFDALTAAARRTPGARVVDLTRWYCDEDTCPVVVGGVNVYIDSNHVSRTYARTLAPYLHRALLAAGVLERT